MVLESRSSHLWQLKTWLMDYALQVNFIPWIPEFQYSEEKLRWFGVKIKHCFEKRFGKLNEICNAFKKLNVFLFSSAIRVKIHQVIVTSKRSLFSQVNSNRTYTHRTEEFRHTVLKSSMRACARLVSKE